MRLRPIEHLENRPPKCKMHTQERQLTHFCILQLIYKEPEPNRRFFKTEPNLKNPFRTSLVKMDKQQGQILLLGFVHSLVSHPQLVNMGTYTYI